MFMEQRGTPNFDIETFGFYHLKQNFAQVITQFEMNMSTLFYASPFMCFCSHIIMNIKMNFVDNQTDFLIQLILYFNLYDPY